MSDFECENCGRGHTPEEVIKTNAVCLSDKCNDTVIAYTIDTAHTIIKLRAEVERLKGEVLLGNQLIGAGQVRNKAMQAVVKAAVEFNAKRPSKGYDRDSTGAVRAHNELYKTVSRWQALKGGVKG